MTLRLALIFIGLASLTLLARAEAADNDNGWSTIKGQIVYAGEDVPERKPVDVTKDQEHCLAKGPVPSDEWVVNPKNKGVQWVTVWLAPADPKSKTPLPVHPALQPIKDKEVVMDQPFCAFIPHALAMRQGQDLLVKNSGAVPHNVNWAGSNNDGGNILIPSGKSYTITGLKPSRIPLMVNCNIHPWMRARVAVLDHPYFAVTDADGKFEIPKAPAGSYRLKIYHDNGWLGGAAGRDGRPITIKDGGVTDLGQIDFVPNK